jgi:hypothetical protein
MNVSTAVASLACLALATACSSTKKQFFPGVSAEMRERMGVVGIYVDTARSEPFTFDTPTTRKDAWKEAASVGAVAPVAVTASPAALLVTPLTILGGAAYGGSLGVPEGKLAAAITSFTNAVESMALADTLPALLVIRAAPITTNRLVLVSADGMAAERMTTLLSIRVLNQQLTGAESYNPDLALHMVAAVELLDGGSGSVLHSFYVQRLSPRHKFLEWAEHESRLFRAEFTRMQDELADEIATKTFLGDDDRRRRRR